MKMWSVLQMVSLVGAMCVFAQCMAIPKKDCPRIVAIYLACQMFFALGTWVATEWIGRVNEWYSLCYSVSVFPALSCALLLSVYALYLGKMYPAIVTEFALILGLTMQAAYRYHAFPWGYKLMIATGISFLVSGFFLLLSLDKMGSKPWNDIRLVLGGFLIAEGFIHWMLPERLHIEREMAVQSYGTAYPLYIAIAAFFLLGSLLYRLPVSP
jgi:hypothetical protein